jgi:asparagine synthase (glutamine-hydrolysing)
MCGILASIGSSIAESTFLKSLETLSHRGPDVQNHVLIKSSYKFGHQKLAITDPGPQSDQPMQTQDQKIALVFNGQIYNYRELIKEHQLAPITDSDSEVILLMYQKYGESMLRYFNGDFAFVIYDEEKDQFLAARDRFGVKPLFYLKSPNNVVFSSETAALTELDFGLSFDNFSRRVFREFRGLFDELTFYNEIQSLAPGCFMLNGKISKYWDFPDNDGIDVDINNIESQLQRAISIRVPQKSEGASLLSGGLDSGLISAIAKVKQSWIVGTKSFNEFDSAQITADYLGIRLEKVLFNEEKFLETARNLIRERKYPIGVPNEVLLSELFPKLALEHKVVLSGEGADELFLGYDRIFNWASSQSKFNLVDFAKMHSYNSEPDLEVYDFALQECYPLSSPVKIVERFFLSRHIQILLNRLDMVSMRSGVEARVPFLDHNLVELVHLSNVENRLNNQQSKISLRKIAKNSIPDSVADQTKVGFPYNLEALFPNSDGKVGPTSAKDSYQKWLDWSYSEFSSAAKT